MISLIIPSKMKLGTLPILKGIFMNLIFGDGAMKQAF